MARERFFLFSLNGGLVSALALARTDLQRMRLTADVFQNAFPRVIGPMQMRGGLGHTSSTKNDAKARQIPFIFSVDDTAKIELSNLALRVLVDDVEVTRNAVSTTVTNGDFSSSTGWTLTTTGGGVANINSTFAGSLVIQTPVRGGTASASRSVSVSAPDQAVEHAIKLTVTAGTIRFRLGTTATGQDILSEAEYAEGVHSIAFTPNAATIYPQLSAKSESYVVVDSLQIEAAGVMELVTPWLEDDLFDIRFEQSGDVIFFCDGANNPRRLERRGAAGSWSLVKYKFVDGPWRGKTANVTLTPSARLGNGTLTASAPFFDPDMVGALFELTHTQTTVDVNLAGNDVYTDSVRISGKSEGTTRTVSDNKSGTWSGYVSYQYSFDDEVTWTVANTYTTNGGGTFVPGSDNTIVFVRAGFQSGDYTSGIMDIDMSSQGGGGAGVVRITGYTDSTHVTYEVIKRLYYTGSTENWQESKYSDYRGWPSAVALFEGRLWWGGSDQVAGSYSDDFTNFNVDEEGDAAPIIRSIATGPVNKVQWMLGLSRLVFGTSGAESVARSSSFDEPMTATNFSIKDASTYGSADLQAVKVDRSGIFVQRSRKRAYDISYDVQANDYTSNEISRYNPTILKAGVKIMAVQRQPDTRIWFCMDDGTAVVLVYEKTEDVLSWVNFTTDGEIEDIVCLPNTESDDVFMIVKRTINGVTKRYREKLAYDSQAEGEDDNTFVSDCYKAVTVTASATVTGLSHLEGETVVVWADNIPLLDDNEDPELFTVTGGQITLPAAVTGQVVVGLPYQGKWRSTKLAYASQTGTAMSQKKIIHAVAPILYNTHIRAALFGKDFDGTMDPVGLTLKGETLAVTDFLADYDYDAFSLPGEWSNDDRLCILMRSPMPCTVLGVGILMESHENA